MPNKYIYRRLDTQETTELMRKAGLSVSDAMKLFGRHYDEVKAYLDSKSPSIPTTPEMFILEFLAEYPEYTEIMLDMANVRITGQKAPRNERV